MDSAATIYWSVLFGSIGLGYFIYGRRQRQLVTFFSGIGLMVFPYFMPNAWSLVLVGIGLLSLPYFIRM